MKQVIYPDKVRYLSENLKYRIPCIELSDDRSLKDFITVWVDHPYQMKLVPKIEKIFWNQQDWHYSWFHRKEWFHRENNTNWCRTKKHFHIPLQSQPKLKDIKWVLESLKACGNSYIDPQLELELINDYSTR